MNPGPLSVDASFTPPECGPKSHPAQPKGCVATPAAAGSSERALAGLLSGAALLVLDFFVVLACLPTIEQTLGASKAQLQMIMAAYAIANGSFLIVGGRLGDAFGRRRMFFLGMAGFAVASTASGLSTSVAMLIGWRLLQGFSGALLQPQVLGLLAVNFGPAERPRVFGLYAAALGVATVAAQLLGGLLIGLLPVEWGWRACFFVSLPLAAISAWLATSARDGSRTASKKVDLLGAGLLAVALGSLCTFLTLGREARWPDWSWLVLGAAVSSGLLFIAWQRYCRRRGREHLLPLELLARNSFSMALLTLLIFFAGIASFYFVLALELRLVMGFTPTQVGLLFAWLASFYVFASSSAWLKAVLGRHGALFGIAGLALGHVGMMLAGDRLEGGLRLAALLASSAFQGLGIGLLMGRLTVNALSRVSSEDSSLGGGMAAAAQQIGNSLGICAIGFTYLGATTSAPPILMPAVLYLLALLACLVPLVSVRGLLR